MRATAHIMIAVLLAGLWACAPAVKPPPPVTPPPPVAPPPLGGGNLFGTVIFEGNQAPPSPVVISAKGRTVKSKSDGTYVLTGLPAGELNIIAEAKSKDFRYLALPKVRLREDEKRELNIHLRDAGDIDRFCAECHPFRGEPIRPDQVMRDAHPSGIKARRATRTTELLDERGFVTCESCHTLHQATDVGYNVIYPYKNGNLCNRCH
jgi:hypothetical protein